MNNEEIKKYFMDELYSKMKFVQETPGGEEFHPDDAYGDHIKETQEKTINKIKEDINANGGLSLEEGTKLFIERKQELFRELMPEIEIYITKIKVDYK